MNKLSKTQQNILEDVAQGWGCIINSTTKIKLREAMKLAESGMITLIRQQNDFGHHWYIAAKKRVS